MGVPAFQLIGEITITFPTKFTDKHISAFKDVRGWQFLTMKAAETLCIVCLPPEEHISGKNLGNRPSKNHIL